jgi:hypothetical protein
VTFFRKFLVRSLDGFPIGKKTSKRRLDAL